MFSFEQFPVYQKAETFYLTIVSQILRQTNIDYIIRDQLNRASLSINLNIAEGSGRHASGEKRHFYLIARGSANECVSILKMLSKLHLIAPDSYDSLYIQLTEISKMLSGLIKNFEKSQV